MASFRSFPPQSSFPPPPNQNPLPPPPIPPGGGNQFPQNRGFSGGTGSQPPSSFPPNFGPNSNTHHAGFGSSSHHYGSARPQPPPPPQQQQNYPYMPPPPPPQSSYPPGAAAPPPMPPSSVGSQPPPLPPSMYYPSSQYPPFNPHSAPPPPPPPSSPPPNPSIPPPPPPSVPPPSLPPPPPPPHSSSSQPHQSKDTRSSNHGHHRGGQKDSSGAGWHSKHGFPPKQHKSSAPPPAMPRGRAETEEERRLRKKREYEKQRQEEKHKQHLNESQKIQMSSGMKGHGSMAGSRMGERKNTPFLSGERIENRLKKPTTFLCKLKFRNELPEPTAQPKLLMSNTNKDQYNKYTITSLEKMHKPKLFVEPDLGIPLDLLDISVYNPPSIRPPLAPEDEELLRDAELTTPVKQDGIRRKERPTDKGFSWLVKTQYISSFSTDEAKTPLSEKQAKERRETRGGRNLLENLNNREKQIQAIEASFEACKLRPVHATNNRLQPVEILPLLPDFDRYDDPLVLAAFDSDPTADSEVYSKLDRSVREEHEAQAIMKSFVVSGSDPAKPEKFLAYMAPLPDELWKDIYDESEDISYSWVREYHWDVRGDDTNDPTTYLVTFGEETSRYLPLPTKLVLRKKRAKEGRSTEEVEHYPVPSSVTVRRRATVAAVELKDSVGYATSKGNISSSKRGRSGTDDGIAVPPHKVARLHEMDHFSEAEDDMSD